jgi:hypothetical protein
VLALDPEVLHSGVGLSPGRCWQKAESANTVRSYAGALRYWTARFRLRYRTALAPAGAVPVPAVLQFLVDHVERSPAGGSRADRSPDDPRRATPRGRHAARSVYGRRVA